MLVGLGGGGAVRLPGRGSVGGMCVCGQGGPHGCVYREEEAGGDEGTARVEGSSATHIQVGLVVGLEHSQEVSTLQLWKTAEMCTR